MDISKRDSNSDTKIIPVILSGGTGTRLWPLSRASYPKQYINFDENNKLSLLQNTYLRIKGLKNLEKPLLICNEEHRFIVSEQMREIHIEPKSILLEPVGRNTAPAIALAALSSIKENLDPVLLVLSSDHDFKDSKKFKNIIEEGIKYASVGRLVTFGIIPKGPETGYGYIEAYSELTHKNKSSKIKKFIEKPNKEVASEFIIDKHFTWNSGIFLFKASCILKEIEKFHPDIVELCIKSLENSSNDLNFQRINRNIFEKCPNIPIDVAVMEQTDLGTVLALDAGWKDIGSWKSIWENSSRDDFDNKKIGHVLLKESQNCYVRSESRLVVGLGINDLIVIETNDAILIADINKSESIKELVNQLEESNYSESNLNNKMFRPWGHYTSVVQGLTWQVKRIVVKPEARLSLQMHHHRSEHWVVVSGTAKVEIDKTITLLSENESIYVPLGSKHRLSNPGKIPLILIEVQSGSYLGEDDIMRFDDIYGRNT